MKKRHIIFAVISILLGLILYLIKVGDVSIRFVNVAGETTTHSSVTIEDKISEEVVGHTTISIGDHSTIIDRSDYDTEDEYTTAVEEAKSKLGIKKQ